MSLCITSSSLISISTSTGCSVIGSTFGSSFGFRGRYFNWCLGYGTNRSVNNAFPNSGLILTDPLFVVGGDELAAKGFPVVLFFKLLFPLLCLVLVKVARNSDH